ncbi:MAG: hypothetical protein ACR2PL_07380 [Dehalococcoidia bacterium]
MAVYALGFLIIVAVAVYIAYPFLSVRLPLPAPAHDSDEAELRRRREILYREIAELDFDRRLGKVDEDDYRDQRDEYLEEAATVLKELDERTGVESRREREADLPSLDSEIESEVRRLRDRARP